MELDDRAASEAELEIDLEAVLGLGSLQQLYFVASIWWPEHGLWVIFPSLTSRSPQVPVLLLQRMGATLQLRQGAAFHFPEGTASTTIRTNPNAATSLWIVSGSNLAVLDTPDQEVVYQSVMPTVVGALEPVRPTTERLGTLDDHVWSAGRSGPAPTAWRVEAGGGPVAYLTELAGRGELLARNGQQTLFFSHSADGVFVTRFDLDAWRFRPGTIRLVDAPLVTRFQLDRIAQHEEGPFWIIAIDGSVTKVEAR